MIDEGYIKFTNRWNKKDIHVPDSVLDEINQVRRDLKKLGIVGKIPGGPSFGNLSVRHTENSFFVTGSDTGGINLLTSQQIALVTNCNISKNQITSEGFIAASSESMSHAAIYQTSNEILAIIHFHHAVFWKHYINILPITPLEIPYGTPELAFALKKTIMESPKQKVIILGGHPEGVISVGKGLQEAYSQLLSFFEPINEKTKK